VPALLLVRLAIKVVPVSQVHLAIQLPGPLVHLLQAPLVPVRLLVLQAPLSVIPAFLVRLEMWHSI